MMYLKNSQGTKCRNLNPDLLEINLADGCKTNCEILELATEIEAGVYLKMKIQIKYGRCSDIKR